MQDLGKVNTDQQELKALVTELVGEPVSFRQYYILQVYDKNKESLNVPDLPRVYNEKSMKEAVVLVFNYLLGAGSYTDIFLHQEPISTTDGLGYQVYVPEVNGIKDHEKKVYIKMVFDETVEYEFDINFDGEIGIK